MRTITLFTRENCHLCKTAQAAIERVRRQAGFEFIVIDIDEPEHETWLERYDQHVPVVWMDGVEIARHRLEASVLQKALG